MKPIEKKILDDAMGKFYDTTGLQLKVVHKKTPFLVFSAFRIHRKYQLYFRKQITPSVFGVITRQFVDPTCQKILVADYVNPQMAERFKEMKIPFLDTAGNAYMENLPVFIYIKGNKPVGSVENKPASLAFQAGGLKVLFLILCQPELVNASYRTIADKAQVALGTVCWVLRDLKKLGYLVKTGKKRRRIIHKEKIMDRWTEAYPEKMRPKLVLGRYRAKNNEWWQNADLYPWNAYWGGEIAAAKLTNHLSRPEQQTIYLKDNLTKFVIQHGFIHDPKGNIEILQPFWNHHFEAEKNQKDLVPPFLIYVDLLVTGEPRNMEIARTIYDQYLATLIGEDR